MKQELSEHVESDRKRETHWTCLKMRHPSISIDGERLALTVSTYMYHRMHLLRCWGPQVEYLSLDEWRVHMMGSRRWWQMLRTEQLVMVMEMTAAMNEAAAVTAQSVATVMTQCDLKHCSWLESQCVRYNWRTQIGNLPVLSRPPTQLTERLYGLVRWRWWPGRLEIKWINNN